eukprot:m.644155 g.644155  ORF g.644155 m.644155 type:complete len:195 (+) comp58352_c0_seq8:4507-5091(+)
MGAAWLNTSLISSGQTNVSVDFVYRVPQADFRLSLVGIAQDSIALRDEIRAEAFRSGYESVVVSVTFAEAVNSSGAILASTVARVVYVDSSSSGLSGGYIALIIIAVCVFVLGVVICIVVYVRARRAAKKQEAHARQHLREEGSITFIGRGKTTQPELDLPEAAADETADDAAPTAQESTDDQGYIAVVQQSEL